MSDKITLEAFLKKVGRQRFQRAIGRSDQLMTRAKNDGLMPSGWYVDVRDWCVANLIDVPEHLFRFDIKAGSPASTKQNVNKPLANQDQIAD